MEAPFNLKFVFVKRKYRKAYTKHMLKIVFNRNALLNYTVHTPQTIDQPEKMEIYYYTMDLLSLVESPHVKYEASSILRLPEDISTLLRVPQKYKAEVDYLTRICPTMARSETLFIQTHDFKTFYERIKHIAPEINIKL